MILQVVACYDKKARAFTKPFYVGHTDLAIRAFGGAANTPGEQVSDHPEDFSLHHLGQFNDETGLFDLKQLPYHLAEAINLKKGS